jgi:hypothetical protein
LRNKYLETSVQGKGLRTSNIIVEGQGLRNMGSVTIAEGQELRNNGLETNI